MNYKKILIIVCAVLFFVAALTSYLNRVIFPRLIKKIAIERIEDALKRKVEIGSIHFNWVRGFIIDKIKIYEKSPNNTVFVQADQVSFGVIFFPGFKHYRITIPFINVRSPSVHLIRTGEDIWNFSDIYTPPPVSGSPSAVKNPKPSAFEIAWGGITISDGKLLVNDISAPREWSEFFDNINLKLSLSYKGISYDFTADIPGKKGLVGATVYYQPVTQNIQAQIHLRNINTASYLSLVNIPDVHLDSGIIKEINLNINHTQERTSAQGDVLMSDFDINSHEQSFKGDIEIRGLDALYQNGDISARGQMALSNVETTVPGLSTGGSVQAKVNDFQFTKEGVTFSGSLHAQNIYVDLKDRQVKVDNVALDDIKVKKDKDGIQSAGSINTQGLFVQWPRQKLQGDITLKNLTMRMKDENDITLEGELQADHFSTSIDDKNISSRRILLENTKLNILDQKNIALDTKLSLDEISIGLGKNILASAASIKTDKLLFDLDDGIVKVSTTLNSSEGKIVLDDQKTIEASPRLELNLQMPLDAPQEMTYKGSITLSDGRIKGFAPVPSLDNLELDTDFQTDEATINALSANIFDTNVRINGTVKRFKNPLIDITAEADEVKLSQLHQPIKHVSATIEGSLNSLKWHDTTVNYMGKKYTLAGSMHNFKNPNIIATLDSPDIQLKVDIVKNKDLITVNAITGKYLNASFDSRGSITLPEGGQPVFDINSNVSFLVEDIIKELPAQQMKSIQPLNPMGMISMTASLKGTGMDWKNYDLNATITSPVVHLMGYSMTGMKINVDQAEGKVKNLTFDGTLYDGTVHAVGSLDLTDKNMPYELALNIDNTDLHKFKIDSPFKMDEINGKFFLTTIAHGTIADLKNNLHATGSLAIRDGYLAEFNLFKGLLSVLNDALRLGQVEITDVEGNFTIDDQKINSDNIRLKGPTIVLLGKGWVNFDQMCDLNVTVDLSSGVVPAIAHDVLNTLNIHIYDKISDPKFKKKISVPQVINTLLRNLLQ